MKTLLQWLGLLIVPALAFAGATSSPPAWTYPGAPNLIMLPTVYAKNLTVLTTGTPADLGTISVPAFVTRYNPTTACSVIAESAAGTLSGATFQVFTGPNGTGTSIVTGTGPASTSLAMALSVNTFNMSTSGTLYVRQTSNSANAGVVSIYVTLLPEP